MKSMIRLLIPTAGFTAIVLVLGSLFSARAQPAPAADAAAPAQTAAQPAPRAAAPLTLCGGCGGELGQVRAVHVAEIAGGRYEARGEYAHARRAAVGAAYAHGGRVLDPAHFHGHAPHGYRVIHAPVWPQPLFSAATVTAPVYVPAVPAPVYGYPGAVSHAYGHGRPGCR